MMHHKTDIESETQETAKETASATAKETASANLVKTLAGTLARSPAMVRSKKRYRNTILFAIVIIAIVAGVWAWKAYSPESVEVAIVSHQRAGQAAYPILRQSGYITYPHIVTIGSNQPGVVAKIDFQEGDKVERGDILASFETATLLAEKELQVARLTDALQTLARTKKLFEAGAATSLELQQAENNQEIAEAQVSLIDVNLAASFVRAPFSGRILQQLADVGERAPAGICMLVDDSETLVEVDINQDDLHLLEEDQPAIIVLDSYPETEYTGRLSRLSPMANRTTNTVQAEVVLLKPDERILPNMSAMVYFVEDERQTNVQVQTMLVVDRGVIAKEANDSFVWIVQDGYVHKKEVETGPLLGSDDIEIVEGLEADDIVINHPSSYSLQEGDKVVPIQ